jgi:hypothetical protein
MKLPTFTMSVSMIPGLIRLALAFATVNPVFTNAAKAEPAHNLCICVYEDLVKQHHRVGCAEWFKDNRAVGNCDSQVEFGKSADYPSELNREELKKSRYSNVLIYGSHHGNSTYAQVIFELINAATESLDFVHLYYDSFACNIFNDVSRATQLAEDLKARFPNRYFSIQGNQNLGTAGWFFATPPWKYTESKVASSKVRFDIKPASKNVEVRYGACSAPRSPCAALEEADRQDEMNMGHSDPNTKTCALPSGALTTQECCYTIWGGDFGSWAKPGQTCQGKPAHEVY